MVPNGYSWGSLGSAVVLPFRLLLLVITGLGVVVVVVVVFGTQRI